MANWNNKPSSDWDRENGWGAVHGVQTFIENLDANLPPNTDPWGGQMNPDKKVSWQDLNANIRYAAFRDFNADFFTGYLPATPANTTEAKALQVLRDYNGFIYDANGDRKVDSAGYTILGRFVSELRSAVFNDDLGTAPNRTSTSTLVHVMNPGAALQPAYNWLGSETREQVAARAFSKAVAALAAQFGNSEPATWQSAQPEQHYTRLNADLLTDVARETARGAIRSNTGVNVGVLEAGAVNVPPGNVPNHIRMNRGTYNHLVAHPSAAA